VKHSLFPRNFSLQNAMDIFLREGMRLDGIRRSLLGHGLVDAPSGFPCDETHGAEVRFDKVFSLPCINSPVICSHLSRSNVSRARTCCNITDNHWPIIPQSLILRHSRDGPASKFVLVMYSWVCVDDTSEEKFVWHDHISNLFKQMSCFKPSSEIDNRLLKPTICNRVMVLRLWNDKILSSRKSMADGSP